MVPAHSQAPQASKQLQTLQLLFAFFQLLLLRLTLLEPIWAMVTRPVQGPYRSCLLIYYRTRHLVTPDRSTFDGNGRILDKDVFERVDIVRSVVAPLTPVLREHARVVLSVTRSEHAECFCVICLSAVTF